MDVDRLEDVLGAIGRDAELVGVRFDPGEGEVGGFRDDFAQLAGEDERTVAGHRRRFDICPFRVSTRQTRREREENARKIPPFPEP